MNIVKVVALLACIIAAPQAHATSTQEQDAQIKQIADLGDKIVVSLDECVASRSNSSASCKRMVVLDRQVADIRKKSLNNLTAKQSAALVERNPLVFQRILRNHRIMCEKHARYLPSNACN